MGANSDNTKKVLCGINQLITDLVDILNEIAVAGNHFFVPGENGNSFFENGKVVHQFFFLRDELLFGRIQLLIDIHNILPDISQFGFGKGQGIVNGFIFRCLDGEFLQCRN